LGALFLSTEERKGEEVSMGEERLPKFDYYLDESDPDVVVLRRQDGTFVAAFSTRGVTKERILEAAKEDYKALLEAYAGFLNPPDHESEEQHRGA
jgi:hypothetical protein